LPAPVVLVIIVVAGEPGWAASSADENFSTAFPPEVKGSPVVKQHQDRETLQKILTIGYRIICYFVADTNLFE
jgi:hypothetical protein